MSIIDTLVSKFPVRKSKSQKAAFRAWVISQASELGYTATEDEKGYSRNVVIGEPEQADVIFTAHYDTPPRLPFPNLCTPTKPFLFILFQIAMSLGMIGAGVLLGMIVGLLTGSVSVGLLVGDVGIIVVFVLMMFGPANPNCVNDNTSGVAAVLELMSRIPAESQSKAAFILFDNEEKGLLGSASYASKHPNVRNNKLLINMDYVGDGSNMLFFANKKSRALPCYAKLVKAMEAQTGCSLLMYNMEKCIYPSDQANFKLSVAICACNHSKRMGYYFDKIHTPKDTICSQQNMDFLANGLAEFVNLL